MLSRRMFNRPCYSGFTLLELLVVVVIIGLLVSIVAPRYFSQLGQSEVKAAKAQIAAIGKALDMYRLDTGHYPPQEAGLQALLVAPSGEAKWRGPYLEKAIPPDPWSTPYQYRMPGVAGDYDLISLGKDGKVGGKDDDADLSNH